jgi:hypothetical protein
LQLFFKAGFTDKTLPRKLNPPVSYYPDSTGRAGRNNRVRSGLNTGGIGEKSESLHTKNRRRKDPENIIIILRTREEKGE